MWHSPLPTAYLNFYALFLQTHLEDPFAYCIGNVVIDTD